MKLVEVFDYFNVYIIIDLGYSFFSASFSSIFVMNFDFSGIVI